MRYRGFVLVRASFLVLALAGCGRLGFGTAADASADACGTHDEDSDGVPDCADHCPHLSDPLQPDEDGDGVGDACDPHPTVARDHILRFESLTSPPANWLSPLVTPTGDALTVDATSGLWTGDIDIVPSSDTFVMGGAVLALGTASTDHQIAIIVSDYPRTYYCELYQAVSSHLSFTYTFDGVGFTNVYSEPVPSFADATFQLTLQHEPTTTLCSASVNGFRAAGGGDNPAISASTVALQLYGLAARVDYAIVIHSD